ncbi:hypothetical protein CYMTET_33014, partial [Cymbomonas tetramitiformis]
CTLCTYPLVSAAIALVFGVAYVAVFWRVSKQICAITVNKVLVKRIRVVQIVCTAEPVLGVILRGLCAVATSGGWFFWSLAVGDVLLASGTVSVLVFSFALRPAYDTAAALELVRLCDEENVLEHAIGMPRRESHDKMRNAYSIDGVRLICA